MNELDLLQTLVDEVAETRQVLYCLGIVLVFGLFWLAGKK